MSTTSAYDARWKGLGDEECSAERAMLPGRLAAVCRRWRHVAVNTPELWTYIAISDDLGSYTSQFAPLMYRVERQLERSPSLGLELFLLHRADKDSYWPFCVIVILHLALRHCQRWRSVQLRFPCLWKVEFFAHLMKDCPTPMLEELYLSGAEGTVFPWIPSSPHLTALGALDVLLCLPPGSPIRSVVSASLSLDSELDLDHFWDVLRALPCLTNLSLLLNDNLMPVDIPILSESISLLSLEALKLRSYSCDFEDLLLDNVITPRLKRFNIEVGMIQSNADSYWGHCFFAANPGIIALELAGYSDITIPHLHTLSALKRLKSLSLIDCLPISLNPQSHDQRIFKAMGPDGRGDVFPPPVDLDMSESGFVDCDDSEPCSPSGLIWPELQSLTIFAPRGLSEELLKDLLFFVRTRAAICSARGTSFELTLLSWPSPFPSWFRAALGCALGPDHVYLSTADGISYAAVPDDDDQEEESEVAA